MMELKNLLNSAENPENRVLPPEPSFQPNPVGQAFNPPVFSPPTYPPEWPNQSPTGPQLRSHTQADYRKIYHGIFAAFKTIERFQNGEIQNQLHTFDKPVHDPEFNEPLLYTPNLYAESGNWPAIWKPDVIETMYSELYMKDQKNSRDLKRSVRDLRTYLANATTVNEEILSARDIPIMHQQSCMLSKTCRNCMGCSTFWRSAQTIYEDLRPWGPYDMLHFEPEHSETFFGHFHTNGSYLPQQREMLACDLVNTLFYTDDPSMVAIWGFIPPSEIYRLTEEDTLGAHLFDHKNFLDPGFLEKKVKVVYAVQKPGQTIVVPSMWTYWVVYKGPGLAFSTSWNLLRAKNLSDARRCVEFNRSLGIFKSVNLCSLVMYAAYTYLDDFSTAQTANEKRYIADILAKLLPILKTQVLEEVLGERITLSMLSVMSYNAVLDKLKRAGRKQLTLTSAQTRDLMQIRPHLPLPVLETDGPEDEEDLQFSCCLCKYILFHSRRSCKQCKGYDLCEQCYALYGKHHPHKMKKYKKKSVFSAIELIDQIVAVLDEFDGFGHDREPDRPWIHDSHLDSLKRKKPFPPQRPSFIANSKDEEDTFDDEVIDCICGNNKDLGFMISCERCRAWLHGKCVGINKRNEPDEYFCPRCVKKQQTEKKPRSSTGRGPPTSFSIEQTLLQNKK